MQTALHTPMGPPWAMIPLAKAAQQIWAICILGTLGGQAYGPRPLKLPLLCDRIAPFTCSMRTGKLPDNSTPISPLPLPYLSPGPQTIPYHPPLPLTLPLVPLSLFLFPFSPLRAGKAFSYNPPIPFRSTLPT